MSLKKLKEAQTKAAPMETENRSLVQRISDLEASLLESNNRCEELDRSKKALEKQSNESLGKWKEANEKKWEVPLSLEFKVHVPKMCFISLVFRQTFILFCWKGYPTETQSVNQPFRN